MADEVSERYSNRFDDEHDREVQQYLAAIIALAALYRAGDITRGQYTSQHIELTEEALVSGVVLANGVLTADQTLAFLNSQELITRESTRKLANDISAGRYTPIDEEGLSSADRELSNRLKLWTFTLGSAYVVGQLTAPPEVITVQGEVLRIERQYQWFLGATERHCSNCLEFSRVGIQPQSYWQSRPPPQSPDLECGGWRCDCNLEFVPVARVIFEL